MKKRKEEKEKKQRSSKKKSYPGDNMPLPIVYNEMDKEILIGASVDSQFLIDDDDDDPDHNPRTVAQGGGDGDGGLVRTTIEQQAGTGTGVHGMDEAGGEIHQV